MMIGDPTMSEILDLQKIAKDTSPGTASDFAGMVDGDVSDIMAALGRGA